MLRRGDVTSWTGLHRARWTVNTVLVFLVRTNCSSVVETKGFTPLNIKSSSCIYLKKKKKSTFQRNLSCLVNCRVVYIGRCRSLYFMFVINAYRKSSGFSCWGVGGVTDLSVLWILSLYYSVRSEPDTKCLQLFKWCSDLSFIFV